MLSDCPSELPSDLLPPPPPPPYVVICAARSNQYFFHGQMTGRGKNCDALVHPAQCRAAQDSLRASAPPTTVESVCYGSWQWFLLIRRKKTTPWKTRSR